MMPLYSETIGLDRVETRTRCWLQRQNLARESLQRRQLACNLRPHRSEGNHIA